MRSTVVVALAALALATSACETQAEPEPTPQPKPGASAVISVTVEDAVGDVGGPRTFAGKFPPADLSVLGYGWSKDGLSVAWTVGEILDKTADHAQVFGADASSPDGDVLFSVRFTGSQVLVTDASGFAHPCPQATSSHDEETLEVVVPSDCVGSHAQLTVAGSVTAVSMKKAGRMDAFDLVSGGQVLVTAENKPFDEPPAETSDPSEEPAGDPSAPSTEDPSGTSTTDPAPEAGDEQETGQ